jgi:predicted DNA-binding transcriptional regulator AlpA
MQSKKAQLPEIGFLRIKQILEIFPVGKSTWWDGVKNDRFPKSVKIGERTTAWKVEDIRALIEKYSNQ